MQSSNEVLKTPSEGNPPSNTDLNTELNNVARNTNDIERATMLVVEGAELDSINGPEFRHTPLHQACFHGRYEMARALAELHLMKGISLELEFKEVGKPGPGKAADLAARNGH